MSNLNYISAIDNCPDRDAYSYLHKVIDVCCDTSHANDQLAAQTLLWNDPTFSDKYVPTVWPNQIIFQMVTSQFIQLCYQIACQLIETEALIAQQPLSAKMQAILQECIEVRRKEIYKAVVFKTITTRSAFLQDYDWSVSVVLSSDRMSNIKEPILKLDFLIHLPTDSSQDELNDNEESNSDEPDESIISFYKSKNVATSKLIKTISFELTKQELTSFISTLEEAKQSLVQAMTL